MDAINGMGERNMKENRKKWTPPQLIVLGRGTPEENVLRGCKTSTLTGTAATKTSCKKKVGATCASAQCNVISKTS
jgi:hypothetical protein